MRLGCRLLHPLAGLIVIGAGLIGRDAFLTTAMVYARGDSLDRVYGRGVAAAERFVVKSALWVDWRKRSGHRFFPAPVCSHESLCGAPSQTTAMTLEVDPASGQRAPGENGAGKSTLMNLIYGSPNRQGVRASI